MATIKITALALIAAAAISDADVLPIVDADAGTPTTYKTTIAQMRTALSTPSVDGGDTLGTAAKRWSDLRAQQATLSGLLTITAGGLTVSAGTSALQALTATTGSFSSDVTPSADAVSSSGTASKQWFQVYAHRFFGGDAGTAFTAGVTAIGGVVALSANSANLDLSGSTTRVLAVGANASSKGNIRLTVADTSANVIDALTIVSTGAVTISQGLTVSAGGITVQAGASAFQAVTATALTVSGMLGIGASPSFPLDVSYANANTYAGRIVNTSATTPWGLQVSLPSGTPGTTTALLTGVTVSTVLQIWSNGNIQNTNNSYGALSDVRLKANISDARPQLDDIRRLRFRNFRLVNTMRDDGSIVPLDNPSHEQLGLIAQEVRAVSPGLVSETAHGLLSVQYSVLSLKTTKAVQELARVVDGLSHRIAQLEEQLAAGAGPNGTVILDSTNNRLCYYVNGNRFYLSGTAF